MSQTKKSKQLTTNPYLFSVMGIVGAIFYLLNHFYIKPHTSVYYFPTDQTFFSKLMDNLFLIESIIFILYGVTLKKVQPEKLKKRKYFIFKTISIVFIILFVFWILYSIFVFNYFLWDRPNPLPFPRKSAL